jgi:hypothetical protein
MARVSAGSARLTGMPWTVPDPTRPDPPWTGGERESLEGWLDFHRATLLRKCQGLTAEQLARRPLAPSTLSLLGLIRHLAEVERVWFRERVAGADDLPDLYCTQEFPDGDLDLGDATTAERDVATLRTEVELARAAAADRSLEETFTHAKWGAINLRWVYLHLIEEYARHNGHADLLREHIDGVTGE